MKKIILTKAQEERAQELHFSSIFIDGLCGNIINPEPPVLDGKAYLDRVRESGVTAQAITIASPDDSFERVLKSIYAHYNLFDYYPKRVMQIKTVEDLYVARREKKAGIIFGLQNAAPVGSDFYKWSILSELGLRVCQMTYNEPNVFGDGCMEPANRGLSFYGKQAVQEMNRQGILIDLSHVGIQTSLDTIEASQKPCIFSHSNALSITPTTKRNLTDEQIKAVSAKGGLVGLSSHAFLCHHTEGIQPTLEDYMSHFIYAAKLVGADHIAIGTDIYEYYTKFYWETKTKLLYNSPWFFETVFNADLKRVDQYINITRGLVGIGFSDDDIHNILGDNYIRIFKQVWKG